MDKDVAISELLIKLTDLTRMIEVQAEEITFLKKENSELRERLGRFENPKNSRNSSIPPSRDDNRPKKNQSLRKGSGRKPGGQPGHKGNTLKMTADPDHIVDLRPNYCRDCGSPLARAASTVERSRQTVDIPPVKAVWTEYRAHGVQCGCGCTTVADFPEGVDSPVGYGSNIEGLIGYFHARQYLPFKRMKEMMGDVFNIDISEGGIHYLLARFADRTTPLYETIKQRIATSQVVGADETGVKVNGKKHWLWTWQNKLLTYIAHSDTRGKAAVDAHFPDGFPGATLVRDGWRPQAGTAAKHHQSCLAHLLRDLNYLIEKYNGEKWAGKFRKLLYDAIDLGRDGTSGEYVTERAKIVRQLQKLLEEPPDKSRGELHTFYKRMCRERQNLFTFLYLPEVPPDNNGSERAVRNVKVKQKISGQFKNERTAQNFAKIRSVIDTTIKNGMNVLDALSLIAKLQPQASN